MANVWLYALCCAERNCAVFYCECVCVFSCDCILLAKDQHWCVKQAIDCTRSLLVTWELSKREKNWKKWISICSNNVSITCDLNWVWSLAQNSNNYHHGATQNVQSKWTLINVTVKWHGMIESMETRYPCELHTLFRCHIIKSDLPLATCNMLVELRAWRDLKHHHQLHFFHCHPQEDWTKYKMNWHYTNRTT